MIKEQTFQLIEGNFSTADGREILENIFNSKIQFHTLNNFSVQERFGKDDDVAIERIPKLIKSLNDILTILKEAEVSGKRVKIKSEVLIQII